MQNWVDVLPHINASLNAVATVLLLVGYWLIKKRQENAHRNVMLACFFVSILFLACYVTYHLNIPGGSRRFPDYPSSLIRYFYYVMLASHVVLAAAVPILAVLTIFLGLTERRGSHRAIARYTFPIWVYVSITGVLVYLFLYHFFPPR